MSFPYPEPTPGEIADELEHQRRQWRRKQRGFVNRWNDKHPYGGVPVSYTKDDGSKMDTTTRSAAEMLAGHTAVIWLDGVSGCVALERVEAR